MSLENNFNFTFCPNTRGSGCHVVGSPVFYTRPLTISTVFQRSFLGTAEDVILGAICAVIIALLSDMLLTILHRARSGEQQAVHPLRIAVFIEDVMHFRIPFSSRITRTTTEVDDTEVQNIAPISFGLATVTVSGVVLLFCTEILAVYMTEPFIKDGKNQYNLRAMQPVMTTNETMQEVNKGYANVGSGVPDIDDEKKMRRFLLSAQLRQNHITADTDEVATSFQLSSWYHRAGSDHEVNYVGQDGVLASTNHSSRVTLHVNNKRLLLMFDEPRSHIMDVAHFLHERFVRAVLLWLCIQRDPHNSSCHLAGDGVQIESRSKTVRRLVLWELANGAVQYENVTGTLSVFRLPRNSPRELLPIEFNRQMEMETSNMGYLLGNAAVVEVGNKPGKYMDMITGVEQSYVKGLLVEKARTGSLVTLSIVLFTIFIVLRLLRHYFQPVAPELLAYNFLTKRGYLGAGADDSESI